MPTFTSTPTFPALLNSLQNEQLHFEERLEGCTRRVFRDGRVQVRFDSGIVRERVGGDCMVVFPGGEVKMVGLEGVRIYAHVKQDYLEIVWGGYRYLREQGRVELSKE
jgi:hypothetical protein